MTLSLGPRQPSFVERRPSAAVIVARVHFGSQQWSQTNPVAVETYRLGNGWWGGGRPQRLLVEFGRCGLLGAAGVRPVADAVLGTSGIVLNAYQGPSGCGNVVNEGPPAVLATYHLNYSLVSIVTSGPTTVTTLSSETSAGNETTGIDLDPAGIVSWFVQLELRGSSGAELPVGTSRCPSWTPDASSCAANATGGYAVLSSQNGTWLDSFGASATGANWSVPSVSFASDQQLLIVYPSAWSLLGTTLMASPPSDATPVDGTTLL
ncbi:MAG TPA: hypothetical protein VMG81_03285 [Thermoplasmata archaeon]|nr:hypothetical protein [Thermoplasmata archaeon]